MHHTGDVTRAETDSRATTLLCEDVDQWAGMHRADDREALRTLVQEEFDRVLPGSDYSVLLRADEAGKARVECCSGGGWPYVAGDLVDLDAGSSADIRDFPMYYGEHQFGRVLVRGEVGEDGAKILRSLLSHYSAALTNLMLRAETHRSNKYLNSSLQALKEGVVLLQCKDTETVAARFLQLCMDSLLGGEAAALLLLERIDDEESELVLDQAFGLPDHMVDALRTAGGDEWWPRTLLRSGVTVLSRDEETGEFPVLDNTALPPVMKNIVGAPLSYHGVQVGVGLVLNVQETPSLEKKLACAKHLFELGAAIFHRFYLEKHALRAKSLDTQVEIASVLQSRFLPTKPPDSEGLEVAWRSVMSAGVGGDYLDIVEGDCGRCFATVSDVSGHGIDSALLMSSFRSTYRANVFAFEPATLLTRLSGTVADEVGGTGMFLTSVSIEIAAGGRQFAIASAGHNPVFLYRAKTGAVESIEASGPPLGLFPGVTYQAETYTVGPGDVLLLYTDGVVEAAAPNRGGEVEMFGEDRLEELLRREACKSAQEVLEEVFSAVHEFSRLDSQEDDVSVLVVKFA